MLKNTIPHSHGRGFRANRNPMREEGQDLTWEIQKDLKIKPEPQEFGYCTRTRKKLCKKNISFFQNSLNFKKAEEFVLKMNTTETDPVTLERRQKQIDYGKNTDAYKTYVKCVPKESRHRTFPRTPEKCNYYR